MEIRIDRAWKREGYTISRLYIDGERICDALEDTDRGLRQSMGLEQLKKLKVYSRTAIPTGRYRVIMSHSPKFGKVLPEVLDVPAFSGIRIHSGNTPADTSGCVLPGLNQRKGQVLYSTKYTRIVIAKIEAAIAGGEAVWLVVGEGAS